MSHADSERVELEALARSRLESTRSVFAALTDCRTKRSGEAP